jgi:hypothetical protein
MPDLAPPPIVCVLGGARSGTHLLNGLLCTSPDVLPMLTEATPVLEILKACRRTLAHLEQFPGVHFESGAEVTDLYGRLLRSFAEHLRSRYRRDVCVFRGPELSHWAVELHALLAAEGARPRLLCMVRDPRDAVASLRAWERRRLERGGEPLAEDGAGVRGLARFFGSFYTSLLGEFGAAHARDVEFVRYEDLVRSPAETAARVGAFAGVDLEPHALATGWRTGGMAFDRDDEHTGEAATELFGHAISDASVGSWRAALEQDEADVVVRFCAPLVRRFYPALIAV